MYLLQYNEQGVIYKIVPDPARGLVGYRVDKLPMTIERLLELNAIEELTDTQNKIYYIIK